MKCATDGCEREALHSINPAVVFSKCRKCTGQLMAQAFGADPERVVRSEVVPSSVFPADDPLRAAERLPVSGPAAD